MYCICIYCSLSPRSEPTIVEIKFRNCHYPALQVTSVDELVEYIKRDEIVVNLDSPEFSVAQLIQEGTNEDLRKLREVLRDNPPVYFNYQDIEAMEKAWEQYADYVFVTLTWDDLVADVFVRGYCDRSFVNLEIDGLASE